jgi:hypothetical protein
MIFDNRDLIAGMEFSQLARLYTPSRRSSGRRSSQESAEPSAAAASPSGQSLIQPRRRFSR